MALEYFFHYSLHWWLENVKSRSKIALFSNERHFEIWFPKKRTITFFWSKLSKLHKKDPILHVATTFSLKQGETRTSHGPIPHHLNSHPEYLGVYFSWCNHQMSFKMVHSNTKYAKSRGRQTQLCYLRTTHFCALKDSFSNLRQRWLATNRRAGNSLLNSKHGEGKLQSQRTTTMTTTKNLWLYQDRYQSGKYVSFWFDFYFRYAL